MRKIFLLMLLLLSSCASARKIPILSFEKRIYIPCTKELEKNPVGKLCFRQCLDRTLVMKKCTDWLIIVEDLSDPLVHARFTAVGFEIRAPKK